MKNLFIKKYVNNNDKSSAFGKTYGRAVMLGTCDTCFPHDFVTKKSFRCK